ncbi:MAG: phosphoglycerate dehydrogenase [Hyphomicrobiales bacterium]|nr:phosphoglycerate dehydrogenase [Hyphomicrobiales bacterium]
MRRLSVPKDRIRIVLLEDIHASAAQEFQASGYQNIETLPGSITDEQLTKALAHAHIVGIRSRTQLRDHVLASASKLFCVGCFCIGTNQVDLQAAKLLGIPVFNAPYSNTRSVAELVIGEIIMLLRRTPEKSALAHSGQWSKSTSGSQEVRGKNLGIVGYGHIGSQVSVLAEALGMRVFYYDIIEKLALGNAQPCTSLDELLHIADVVTMHVPSTPATRNMIGEDQFVKMKPGAVFINAARGDVIDIAALAKAIKTNALFGAAVDVFPSEPSNRNDRFTTPLQGLPNVILTPHVGGSTLEAQANIGKEVAQKIIRYSDNGSTLGAVNFVEVSLPVQSGTTRFLHIHRNIPGVIANINRVFSERQVNITAQYLRTEAEVGYVVSDIDGHLQQGMGIRRSLQAIDGTIRTRFLF